jgi:hypothetical protein
MERGDGKVGKVHSATYTMEITVMTRNMDTEYSPGQVGTSIKESTRMMKGMALER